MRSEETHEREAESLLAKFSDHPISFTDAVSFAVMRDLAIARAFTLDRHFVLLGSTDRARFIRAILGWGITRAPGNAL